MNGKDVVEHSLAMRIARVSVLHPAGMVALALWTIANLAVVILARGSLPFDRPVVASMPFATQVASPTLGFLEIFALMGVVYAITRTPPDLAARAPAKATALADRAPQRTTASLKATRRSETSGINAQTAEKNVAKQVDTTWPAADCGLSRDNFDVAPALILLRYDLANSIRNGHDVRQQLSLGDILVLHRDLANLERHTRIAHRLLHFVGFR